MTNFWLSKRLKRRIGKRLEFFIYKCMKVTPQGRPYMPLDEQQVNMAVEYAAGLADRKGYIAAMEDIESLIETAISIDWERFLRKTPRA